MKYLLMLILLSGCCSLCPPKVVYVAAECPKPSMVPECPIYKIDSLTEKSTARDTIEAFVLDLEECQTFSDKLAELLNAYGTAYKKHIGNPSPPK